MYVLIFLISFPFVAAVAMLFLKSELVRSAFVKISALVIAASSIALFASSMHLKIQLFEINSGFITKGMFIAEMLIAVYIFYTGIKHKRPLTYIFIFVQSVAMAAFEVFFRKNLMIEHSIGFDRLSLLMTVIIGVIGSAVAVYSIAYMRDFHKSYHREVKDSRNFFFFVIFAFLSAMFGIVYSNNLLWLFFFWELTSLASFLLIGYKRTDEARRKAFHALELNLIAGILFSGAIFYLYFTSGVCELSKMIAFEKTAAILPAALLCVSGLIKSAQFPFSSWLIGAMVGPAPASALLHSSTMVKAGIYMMIRMTPVVKDTVIGGILAAIGGITFLLASIIGIEQNNAKSVLAYSTVANLGLIFLCAGIGTHQAMWAALLLMIFHAMSKSLLFMAVGTVDNKIRSTDIEDMAGLVVRMPRLSVMLQIGIAGMFLAPFGMLISKWAAINAIVDYNPLLAVFVVFGGSAMLFFWVKWLGKLITVAGAHKDIEKDVSLNEWVPLYAMASLSILFCMFFPVVCDVFVNPYLAEMYGKTVFFAKDNVIIMGIMLGLILIFPFAFINYGKHVKVVDAYLGGANTDSGAAFRSSMGNVKNIEMRNYYLGEFIQEKKFFLAGVIICGLLVTALLGVAAL